MILEKKHCDIGFSCKITTSEIVTRWKLPIIGHLYPFCRQSIVGILQPGYQGLLGLFDSSWMIRIGGSLWMQNQLTTNKLHISKNR